MPIEKAFAIEAPPDVIWDALWSDLTAGDPERYVLDRSNRPERLALQVTLGGLPVLLDYTITPRDGPTEVAVTLVPLSLRHRLYQLVTFGHFSRNYEILLVQGLANLKSAVESKAKQKTPPQ